VWCPNDIIAIDERSSRLACASMHSFTRSFIHSRDSSDRPTDRLKARSTPSRRSVLRRSRVGRARRPARSRRRHASFAPHRPRRPSRLARIVGTHESSLAPPPPFSLCFVLISAAASRCLFPSPSTTRARLDERTRRRSHRRRRRDRSVERRRARVDFAPSTRDVAVASRGALRSWM